MKLRIYKSFQAYGTYLDNLYSRKVQLRTQSFAKQLEILKEDSFPWILSWSQNNHDDQVEIFETIHNNYYLQQAWANNKYLDDPDWQKKIVLEQIKSFQPDVCVIYPPSIFDQEFVSSLRGVLKHDVLIGGYDGMDRQNISLYRGYDFIITCSKYISNYYDSFGIETFPLEFGFDPMVNRRIVNSARTKYPVSFSGSIYGNVHNNRLELLKYLAKKTSIVISSEYEYNRHYSLFSKRAIKSILTGSFDSFLSNYNIHKHNIGPKYGLEMFQFLKDSGVSLNLHGDGIKFAANVRLYEATGVGSCLLTDNQENISEIFVPNKEVVVFDSPEEAVDKIKYLMKHDNERAHIAQCGQTRTLSEYTYEKRIAGVINYIKQLV